MSLTQVRKANKLATLRGKLNEWRKKERTLKRKLRELEQTEEELEQQVEEAAEAAVEENMAEVEASITETQEEIASVSEELAAVEEVIAEIVEEMAVIEEEVEVASARATRARANASRAASARQTAEYTRTRNRFGTALSGIVSRDDVKTFLTRVREMKGQQRAVKGAHLTIPEVMLDLLRDNMHRYSKLISIINLRTVSGKARQTIAGQIPEAVWTEACASLNELDIDFSQIEVDGYKVGGFVPICNATLEDSDLNLADEILDMIGQAIGLAIDKAILYGPGIKMPLGIGPRLAQTAAPSDWNPDAPEWTDLHINNIVKMNPASYATNVEFFSALLLLMSIPKSNFSTGVKFWSMNERTWKSIVAKTVEFNAAGALVATEQETMPLDGGQIVLFDFIPDGDIIGGYASIYLLAERAGTEFAVSEHVRFLDDQTVYKGSARYDGMPVFGEGFVAININNQNPTTSMEFAPDTANIVVPPIAMPASGTFAGSVDVHLYSPTPNARVRYTTDGSNPTAKSPLYKAPVHLDATATIKAITTKEGAEPSAVTTADYTIG